MRSQCSSKYDISRTLCIPKRRYLYCTCRGRLVLLRRRFSTSMAALTLPTVLTIRSLTCPRTVGRAIKIDARRLLKRQVSAFTTLFFYRNGCSQTLPTELTVTVVTVVTVVTTAPKIRCFFNLTSRWPLNLL